jgi:C1A family cysteine protease
MVRKILLFGLMIAVFFAFSPSWAGPLKVADLESKIKAASHKWKSGETSVSKLSPDKWAKKLGLKKPKKVPLQIPKLVPKVALPALIDYRTRGYVSAIKDQDNCGSCWAFAATGALESIVMMGTTNPNSNLNLSEQTMVSCDTNDEGCNGGYPDEAANFVVNSGLPLEFCFPYLASDLLCSKACPNWQANAYRAQSWTYASTISGNLTDIKIALVNYGPVSTTMNVYSDFMYYVSGVYKQTSGILEGSHAILIVGYDDADQAFIVKNSWGTGWGELGYFSIAYSELSSVVEFGAYTIYFIYGAVPPPPPPPPTPGCSTKSNLSNQNQHWFWKYFK